MCGIVGYTGPKEATPLLLEGLKRLEYRGYDSAGLAVLTNGHVELRRSVGKLANLDTLLKKEPLKGTVGLGHTRWATHGRPSEENAHPHTDCSKKLVVIHNGIIENYVELKGKLMDKGHVFASETDTEIVAHLIEDKLSGLSKGGAPFAPDFREPMLFEAVRQALAEVRGAYALAILWSDAPGTLIAAKTASPLVVGLGKDETFLASDVPAFLDHTRKVVFLEDGEMAVISSKGVSFFNLDGKKVEKTPITIQWDRTMAEKGGYRHFMLKEIHEQPIAVEDTLRGRLFPLRDGVLEKEAGLSKEAMLAISNIQIVACGTAFHAGLVAKYWLESIARIPTQVETASEFRYREPILSANTLCISVSQSGETADTLAAVRLAKQLGVKILSVCNTVGAAIPRAADYNLYTLCGPECGVASTKAFVGQLVALATLTLHLAIARGKLDEKEAMALVDEMLRLPNLIRAALKLDGQMREISKKYFKAEHFLYIGRNVNYPTALEGALKLKEISYIHAEGYAAGEMKHGPIALIDPDVPVVAIATQSKTFEKVLSNIEEARARGAILIAIVNEGETRLDGKADHILRLPVVSEFLSPIVNVVPLQLLAYHMADLRGCDVDQPRNLAKSVTVE
ncbi:MAG: glutamine--fructose-6-phosphate transaminase (isomerizing) [Elusimicrobia bacterium]|nr:glutamine--fructose-6-phosphate transaminase (isomerizing) [Elusimicrobiota bacterium]